MHFHSTSSKSSSLFSSLIICMTLLCTAKASRRNCPPNMMARYKMEIQGTWTDAGLTGQLLPRGFPVQWRWLTGIGVSLDGREDPYYNETVRTKLYDFVKKGGLSRTVTELTQPASGVLDTFLLPPLDSSMGESSSVFFIDTNHSHVSFMSRMNRKPHWILSVESVDLCHNGQFRDTFELDLFPFENKPRIVQRSNSNNANNNSPPTPERQSFSGYKKNYGYPNHNYDLDIVNRPQQNRQNNQRNVSPTRKYFRQNGEPTLVALNTHNSVYRSPSNANGPIYLHNIHNGRADRQELVTPAHIPTAGYNVFPTTKNQTASPSPSTTAKPNISVIKFFLTMPPIFRGSATTPSYPFLSYPRVDSRPEPMSRERLNRPEPRIHKSDPYIDIMDASPSPREPNTTTSQPTTATTATTKLTTSTTPATISDSTAAPTKRRKTTKEVYDVSPTIRPRRPGYRFFPIIKSAPSNSRRRLPPDSENEISSSRNRRAVRYGQPSDASRGFISTAGDVRADFSQPSRFVPNTYRVPHSNQEKNYRQQTQPEVMPRLATVKFTKLAVYHLSHVPGRRRLSGLGRNGQQVAPLPITIDKSLINSPHLPYPANPLRSPANSQYDRQRPSQAVNNESGSHLRRSHRLLTQPSYPF